jgi:hypothetical protein
MGEEYQNPALQRKLTTLAAEAAERDPEQAAHLERLAAKIAETTGPTVPSKSSKRGLQQPRRGASG